MSNPVRRRPPRFADRFLLSGVITDIEDVSPRLRRIRLAGESLRDLDWLPGNHVRVLVGELSVQSVLRGNARDILRTYSVWDYRPAGELDLCVFDHSNPGPGAAWAASARTLDEVHLTKPEGRLTPRDSAAHHLFVGDETASVAFGPILRALPPTATVAGVIERGFAEDQLPLRDMTWVDRGEGALLRAVEALSLPETPGVAYLAGEAKACQAVRRHLVLDRHWPRDRVVVKPFWAPGKRGLD